MAMLGLPMGPAPAPIMGFDPISIGISIGFNLIVGALFPTKVEGPRMTSLRIQNSQYGAAIPRVWGPRNRLAGNIIFSSGLIEKSNREKSKGKGKTETTSYTYSVSLAVLVANGETDGLSRIWANGRLIFDRDNTTWTTPIPAPTADVYMRVGAAQTSSKMVWSRISYYNGTGTQLPDPYLESVKGVGDTPAYRHSSYVVIENLQLADYGNMVPNFEFELSGGATITLGEIIREMAGDSGVDGIGGVAGTPAIAGYVYSAPGTTWDAMSPLLSAYGYDLADQGGYLRLKRRGRGMKGVLDPADLGVGFLPVEPGDVIVTEREDDRELPRESAITFNDLERDLQPNSVMTRRQVGTAASKLSVEVALSMTTAVAATLADLTLYQAWAERRTVSFTGSRKHDDVQPGDVWGVPVATRDAAPYRITKRRESGDGIVEFEGTFEDAEAYNAVRAAAPAAIPPNNVLVSGDTTAILIDGPMLSPGGDDTGFYWVGAGEPPGWRGADLYRSSDDGDTWLQQSGVGLPAVIGHVASPPGAQRCDVWDRATVITVVLLNPDDELETKTEQQVLNGANAFWLGAADGHDGEVIQFQTAELVAPGTYELTNLLRGRRGTDHAVAGHGADEVFVLIEPDTMHSLDFGQNDWNRERLYAAVSILQDIADVTPQAFTNTGERKRPFTVGHVHGMRDSSNNLDMWWRRRVRSQAPDFGGGPAPIGETNGLVFAVEFYSGATLKRTKTATFPPNFQGLLTLGASSAGVYTAAEQTADGLTPGAPVSIVIYQQSDFVSDGHARAMIV